MEVNFTSDVAKTLWNTVHPDGTVEQLKADTRKVQDEYNLLKLEEETEGNKLAEGELEKISKLLEEKLDEKLKKNPPASNVNNQTIDNQQNHTRSAPPARRRTRSFSSLLRGRLSVEQHRIRELTEQARCDLRVDGLAKRDVNDIVEHIKNSLADDRIASLYLIDSIVKNVGKIYINLFENHVEGILVSTFKHGKKKARDAVVKIFREWHKRKLFNEKLRRRIYDNLKKLVDTSKNPPNNQYSYNRNNQYSNPYNPNSQHHPYNPKSQRHPYHNNYPYPNSQDHRPYENNVRTQPPPINIPAIMRHCQNQLQSRPDLFYLFPQLENITQKARRNENITQELIELQALINAPTWTPTAIGHTLKDLEKFLPSEPKLPLKRKRSGDGRNKKKKEARTGRFGRKRSSNDFWYYKATEMRKYHRRSLELLYSKKLAICHICALRLPKDLLEQHRTEHYKEKQKKVQKPTRSWNQSSKDWILKKKKTDEKETPKKKVKSKQVLADDNYPICTVCNIRFEQFYDENYEQYMYKDCVYEDGKVLTNRAKPIVHYLCYLKKCKEIKQNKEVALAGLPKLEACTSLDESQDTLESSFQSEKSSQQQSEEEDDEGFTDESSDESDSGTEIILFMSDTEDTFGRPSPKHIVENSKLNPFGV